MCERTSSALSSPAISICNQPPTRNLILISTTFPQFGFGRRSFLLLIYTLLLCMHTVLQCIASILQLLFSQIIYLCFRLNPFQFSPPPTDFKSLAAQRTEKNLQNLQQSRTHARITKKTASRNQH